MDASLSDPQPAQSTPVNDVKPKRSFAAWWGIFTVLFITLLAMTSLYLARRLRAATVHNSAVAVATVPPSKGLSLPLYGLKLEIPPDWRQVPPDRSNIAVRWISPGSREDNVSGAIMIEVAKPAILDVERIAAGLAERWHGELVDKPDTLGGEPACRIVASVTEDLQPVEGLVCIHQGRLYLIEGDVTDGHACHDQIETIRQGWAWIPLDPLARIEPPSQADPLAHLDSPLDEPARHLEFRYQPTTIFKGKVSINFPTAMRLTNGSRPEATIMLSLHDYQHDHADFLAFVQSGQLVIGDTLAHVQERLGVLAHANFQFSEEIVWHKIKSDSARCEITQPLPAPGWRDCWVIWSIVLLPDNKLVLTNFMISADNAEDGAFYAQTAEKIIATVMLSPEGKRDLEQRKPPVQLPRSHTLTADRGGSDSAINPCS